MRHSAVPLLDCARSIASYGSRSDFSQEEVQRSEWHVCLQLEKKTSGVGREPHLSMSPLGEDAGRRDGRLDDDRIERSRWHRHALTAKNANDDRIPRRLEV